ncbi:MAG: glycosyltransferase [Candidatus Rifleibacteriota bacterium]
MTTKEPYISIVIPVYNADRFLNDCLNSIKSQTFQDYEVILVNDGSSDKSKQIILDFTKEDKRFRIIDLPQNRGIVNALNRGIEVAGGKFIARMDADDICFPERFARQVDFMEKNPDVVVLGTGLSYINENGEEIKIHRFADLTISLLFQTPLFHPTVMIRKNPVISSGLRYREEFRYAEDYCLWLESAKMGNLASLNEVLLFYRNSDEATRFKRLHGVIKATLKVKLFAFFHLGYIPEINDLIRFLQEFLLLFIPARIIKKVYMKRLSKNKT